MAYKEYDNVFISNSRTPCPPIPPIPPSTLLLARNGCWRDVEDGQTRNMYPLVGDPLLIYEQTVSDPFISAFVASDNYLYFNIFKDDGYLYVCEYCFATQEVIDLQVASGIGYYLEDTMISIIENRKILILSTDVDDYYKIYIADFSTNSVTIDFTWVTTYPTDARVMEYNNNIYLISVGYRYRDAGGGLFEGGLVLNYKNYTQNSSWTEQTAWLGNPGEGGFQVDFGVPVSNRYMAWFISNWDNADPLYQPMIKGVSFDLETLTLGQSAWCKSPEIVSKFLVPSAVATCFKDGTAYYIGRCTIQTSYEPWESAEAAFVFKPSDLSISRVYYCDHINGTDMIHSFLFSSSQDVLLWHWDTGAFENLTGSGNDGGVLSHNNFVPYNWGNGSAYWSGNLDDIGYGLLYGGKTISNYPYVVDTDLHFLKTDGSTEQTYTFNFKPQVHYLSKIIAVISWNNAGTAIQIWMWKNNTN